MTSKDYRKTLKQIEGKPAKKLRYLKLNKPKERTTGIARRRCKRCGRRGGHIRKYGLNVCRQCFREIAKDLGFRKYGHEV